MDILLLSRTLESLNSSECRSSSAFFELSFARALSTLTRTVVISRSAHRSVADASLVLEPMSNPTSLVQTVRSAIRQHSLFGAGGIIVVYGYDPVQIGILKVLGRLYGAQVVAYVFDHHSISLEAIRSRFRRHVVNFYFSVGIRLLRRVDGVLLLNEAAYAKLGLRTVPNLVSRVGAPLTRARARSARCLEAEPYRLVYAGSLESCNAVMSLIDALAIIDDVDLKLDILGDGSQLAEIQRRASEDTRITVHGRLPKGAVDSLTECADLLVNLRDLAHPIAAYSFPSKLIEYLASGIPVLTTRVIEDSQFDSVVTIVEHLSAFGIASAIKAAKSDPRNQSEKAARALQYVHDRYRWADIANEVSGFLHSIAGKTDAP